MRLSTQARLIAVICLIAAVFGCGYWALRVSQALETDRLVENLRHDRSNLAASVLMFNGESLSNFSTDYSYWDEMIEFVRTGDPKWGHDNIEVSLATFRAHGAWVLCPDGKQIYGSVRAVDQALMQFPVPLKDFLPAARHAKFLQFFHDTPVGLMEFRVAPIQPTADSARVTPPQGWFIVARLWDRDQLNALQRVLDGTIEIDRPGRPKPAESELMIRIVRPLRGIEGLTLAELRSDYFPRPLAMLLTENEDEKLLIITLGLVIVAFLGYALGRWVLRPLRMFERSLAHNTSVSLRELAESPDIFGRLATLISAGFDHRRALEREVEERRRIERALRQSEESLRHANELRTRLARDLHDSVIQSIYAAGLGLEGVRGSLSDDPAAAERKLNAAQASLNQTIREVRSFIQGLEPEEAERATFAQSLQSLVAALSSLHDAEVQLKLDLPNVHLSSREELHALQIIREGVSNAHRHGRARHIVIHVTGTAAQPELILVDDGQGFDVEVGKKSGGSGLANLAARCREMEAQFELVSAPPTGTRIHVRFAPR